MKPSDRIKKWHKDGNLDDGLPIGSIIFDELDERIRMLENKNSLANQLFQRIRMIFKPSPKPAVNLHESKRDQFCTKLERNLLDELKRQGPIPNSGLDPMERIIFSIEQHILKLESIYEDVIRKHDYDQAKLYSARIETSQSILKMVEAVMKLGASQWTKIN
ncbi:hypothetical protein [Leptospira sp. GIMC2001]|uniref:hypothetical protein n=1 Tax=Leptospira sp. GIMC2001 TaxID=1513297 RepID=UPI0023497F8F|nr:hypothetical protein [Leptospira sp. GIMC2001]WCL51500.1 hypothetical protein O4O04_19995 [Leptospira sp. GIMC2001]